MRKRFAPNSVAPFRVHIKGGRQGLVHGALASMQNVFVLCVYSVAAVVWV
ncbi:E5 early protein [Bos taurus papillomavirus 39]|nr:E5 early protein [Bos taurus papillomavirus 39]